MPSVYYRGTSSAKVASLKPFENFLDGKRERISSDLHTELAELYEEINVAAEAEHDEYLNRIDDLENEVKELKEQLGVE